MYSNPRKYKLFSLIMASLMFITSVGFSVDMHYCNGQLKSISLFGEAKSCHDTTMHKTCPYHKNMQKDKDCCENKTLVFQADIDKELENEFFVLSQNLELSCFIVAFTEIFLDNLPRIDKEIIPFDYTKPPAQRDIYVLLETFLL